MNHRLHTREITSPDACEFREELLMARAVQLCPRASPDRDALSTLEANGFA